ncbi:MAG: C4-type zinc ribbon domain-containing protein [Bacteroidaceae bacterium]|nr:C4-type zinc ribbon domain-containing protein [Bacteroidaceae bacterium]
MSNETSREKNQSEMSVEQKLKMLYDLQTVLSQIDEISIMRGELPNEVRNLEDEIEGLNVHQDKLRDEIKSIDTNVSKWKEEKNVAQATIEKNNSHLEKVRNSREYDSLSKEIEFQSLEIELRDKRIREATEQRKMRLDEIARTEEEKNNREEDLSAKKSELDDIIRETKVQEDELREKAKEYEDKMDARLLKAFKRIRKNSRNGLGIVYVQRDACGGCFNKIPPQRQLDIRMRKKVIVCEYCGRIMIDPELAGVIIEKPVEEPKKKSRRGRATKEKE